MKYTVSWLPEAEEELAAVWLAAADRTAVTRAAAQLDLRLKTSPAGECESRAGEQRITFEPPLAIVFQIVAETLTVEVGRVWEYPTRRT